MSGSLSARLFLASHGVVRFGYTRASQALELGKALHTGFWLGALSPEALVELDEAAYRRVYAYHGTEAHNTRGLFDWERSAVERFFPPSGRVLVTSVGGGREVLALRQRGLEVDGSECNEALRAFANQLLSRSGFAGDILPAPRDVFPVTDRTYDAAVVGWGAITYVRGTARRRAFLAGLRAALRPETPVLLSFYARASDAGRLRVVRATGNAVGRWLGREPLELGDVLDPTYQHYFSRDELRDELESAGFSLRHFSTEDFAHAVARAER